MTGYVDEMLARQALAAEEQTAAARLLERMRLDEWGAVQADAVGHAGQKPVCEHGASREWPHGTETVEIAEIPTATRTASARRDGVASDLLQRLQALAEPVVNQLVSMGEELNKQRVAEGEVSVARDKAAEWALSRMDRRLAKAVLASTTARTLPADGVRDIGPGGTTDAAALSRLYERDSRRYDGFFELPL